MKKLTKEEIKKKVLGSIMSGDGDEKSEAYEKMKEKRGATLTIVIGQPEEKDDEYEDDMEYEGKSSHNDDDEYEDGKSMMKRLKKKVKSK